MPIDVSRYAGIFFPVPPGPFPPSASNFKGSRSLSLVIYSTPLGGFPPAGAQADETVLIRLTQVCISRECVSVAFVSYKT
jgi:hypothetical protein